MHCFGGMGVRIDMKPLDLRAEDKTVIVLGLPASGKTTLVDELKLTHPEFTIFRTDDYMHMQYDASMYSMLRDVAHSASEYRLIEGVQCYRLLRKALQESCLTIDLVVHVICPEAIRFKRAKARGKNVNIKNMDHNLTGIWYEITSNYHIAQLPRIVEYHSY